MHTEFWWEYLRKKDNLEDPCVVGRIILEWIFKNWDVGMEWIDLLQDRDRFQAVVNAGNFLPSWGHVSFSGRSLLHRVSSIFVLSCSLGVGYLRKTRYRQQLKIFVSALYHICPEKLHNYWKKTFYSWIKHSCTQSTDPSMKYQVSIMRNNFVYKCLIVKFEEA